nr:hypothetical protein [Tanacetum cinerariifolium]
ERKPRKGQNQIKTGQKREACQSQEKFKVVAVDKGRKTEENAKRMVENAYSLKFNHKDQDCLLSKVVVPETSFAIAHNTIGG